MLNSEDRGASIKPYIKPGFWFSITGCHMINIDSGFSVKLQAICRLSKSNGSNYYLGGKL
ncbi:MAG: hypothetical protein FDW93_03600 [Bergeyella sp.]|nr:hypothetical protein [Bergeyella sp.]